VFGPDPNANPAGYFINPNGIQYIVMSASELGASTTLTTDTLMSQSVNVNLLPSPGAPAAVRFPLVQGMGFVTGIYNGATPILQTGVFFRTLTKSTATIKAGVTKYTLILEDGSRWMIYSYSASGQQLDLKFVNNRLIQATSNFFGTLQIAKAPDATAEALYDAGAGAYATGVALSGEVNGKVGTYTFGYSRGGVPGASLVMFALPHHVQSFAPATARQVTSVQLQTTTKGKATAVVGESWTLQEAELPVSMSFAPWSAALGSRETLSAAAKAAILEAATAEISQDMYGQANLDSFYYGGKALAKFAQIVYTVNDLLSNPALAQAGLVKLKTAFELWTTNRNKFPLYYETAWGGIVSSASYTTGDGGVDFGNSYYNDHHFHYGYFILAAAYIGKMDAAWLASHKDYINMMVRDTANPSSADPYFPVNRGFDWYHGHSWAKGLFESFDGKDQESSSEDAMFAYALKMWGKTTGDPNMEARGNLQLSVVARSIRNYFLYESDNTVQPARIIGNKVSGILFENKIDHTTYFGTNIEYIQGIQMIPLLPSSTLTRTKKFVQEEWDRFFSGGRADAVIGGWRGLLMANLMLIDPKTSWNFFTRRDFDPSWLDGGASRTWYLALAAGMLPL
jgi:endo-1,3(4)-beta-glucanase